MDRLEKFKEYIKSEYPKTRQHPKTLRRVDNQISIDALLYEVEKFSLADVSNTCEPECNKDYYRNSHGEEVMVCSRCKYVVF